MTTLNTKQVTLGGNTYTLKLSTAATRIAQMKHDRKVDVQQLEDDPLGMQATLVWLAMLPYHPDVTEEEAMLMLARSEEEAEITSWATKAFMRFMREMGKRLSPQADGQTA